MHIAKNAQNGRRSVVNSAVPVSIFCFGYCATAPGDVTIGRSWVKGTGESLHYFCNFLWVLLFQDKLYKKNFRAYGMSGVGTQSSKTSPVTHFFKKR